MLTVNAQSGDAKKELRGTYILVDDVPFNSPATSSIIIR